jgi:hypothetical protein
VNFFPQSRTHPTRQPFSAAPRYIDGKGPAPVEFFDATQDNLGALYHAHMLTDWSGGTEDFDRPIRYPSSSYIGDFRIVANTDIAAGPGLSIASANAQEAGEHGVWSFLSGTNGWLFDMQTGTCHVGTGDFLVSCKLRVVSRARLSTAAEGGIWMGCGARADGYPAITGGSDSAYWHIYAPTLLTPLVATDIPFYDEGSGLGVKAWNVLQISRVSGALRFFINGRLAYVDGKEGVYDNNDYTALRRYLYSAAWHATPANDGFYVDYFHRLCRRG